MIDGKSDKENDSTTNINYFSTEEVNDVFNLGLWILEQGDNIQKEVRVQLFTQAWNVLDSIIKKDKNLIKTFKFDKKALELLIVRCLTIDSTDLLQPVLEVFHKTGTLNCEALESHKKVIVDVFNKLTNDFYNLVKSDGKQAGETVVGQLCKPGDLTSDQVINFFSFLIQYSFNFSQSLEQSKNIVDKNKKSKESSESFTHRKDMSNMTPEEVAVHRSLSLSSQKPEILESEIIPSNLLMDILEIINLKYSGSSNTMTFFSTLSKIVFVKSSNTNTLQFLFQLLSTLDSEKQVLLLKDLITNGGKFYQ